MCDIYPSFGCVFGQFFKANLIKNDILCRLIFIDFSDKDYIHSETVKSGFRKKTTRNMVQALQFLQSPSG